MADVRIVVACFCTAVLNCTAIAQQPELIGIQKLPDVKIDGKAVKIHTQGLYVTRRDYIVTGRVDTPPRRPVVIRFPRDDLQGYEVLDLSAIDTSKANLDHPGGFDRDEYGVFWIPLSTSHRRGPTVILGLKLNDGNLPSDVSELHKSFEFPDHVGALGCLGDGRLLAANWDTKTVYLIDSSSGEVEEEIAHDRFFGDAKGIHLAVQDWKFDAGSKLVIAGGIDKSSIRKPGQSDAVVAWIDPELRKIRKLIRLDRRNGVARPLTNEGMSVRSGELFLIPEDIGRGAKVLQMSMGEENQPPQ
jgi:hypothetical protein